MQILTRDGYKDILNCSIGEEVKYYDTNTGEVGFNTIEVIEPKTAKNYPAEIETNDEDEDGNIIASIVPTNNDTNWYVVNDTYTYFGMQSVWSNLGVVHANQLSVGDIIYNDNNDDVEITSVSTYINEDKVWYRMAISGDSSFIADGVTLHNASRYWVGGTGTWNSTTTHWGSASGTADNASVPTSVDDVIFNASSNATAYICTISTVTAVCNNIDFTNPTSGALTFAGFVALQVYGSFTVHSTITRTFTGTILFADTAGGKTINTNSVSFASTTTFNGVGGGWQLLGALTNSSMVLTNGTLDTNGQTITQSSFSFTLGAGTKTLTLGNTSWGCNTFNIQGNASGLTLNSGTSTITPTTSFLCDTATMYNVTITGATTLSSLLGSCSFHNLSVTSSAAKTGQLILATAASTITVSNALTLAGNSAINRLLVFSLTIGSAVTISMASVTVSNVDFQDITGSGAGSWSLAGLSSGDCGGNTGITFDTPINCYMKTAASANWSASNWFTTSGGSTPARVPLPQDTALFDANSITAGSVVITQDMPRISGVDWTGATNSPSFSGSVAFSIFGSLRLITGFVNVNWSGVTTLAGRGNYTIKSANNSLSCDFILQALGGTYTLEDKLASPGKGLTLSSGTFTNPSFDVTLVSVLTSGTLTKVLNMGSGTWTVSSATAPWNISTSGLTVNPGTSTIKITDTTNTAMTFMGGGLNYYKLWFSRLFSTANITIAGSNTYYDFKDDGLTAHSILITDGTTQTMQRFNVNGNNGRLVTITGTSTGTHSLVLTGSNLVSCDYLNIQHSVATPSSTWYAGANSVNNQGISSAGSGWIFSALAGGSLTGVSTLTNVSQISL